MVRSPAPRPPLFRMSDRLSLLLQYLDEDPTDAFTRFALAQEYLKRGEDDQAAEYFEGLVRDEPMYVGTYYHLGKLYERMNRPSKATETYEEGIRIARELRDFHALSELQTALLEARNPEWDEE